MSSKQTSEIPFVPLTISALVEFNEMRTGKVGSEVNSSEMMPSLLNVKETAGWDKTCHGCGVTATCVKFDFNSCCNFSTINPNVVVHCYINDIPFSRPVA